MSNANWLLRFDDFLEAALYGPHGFYAAGHGAGTTRDFLTSPEVGSLFGAVLARKLDTEWNRLGQPAQFTLIDAGAGPGTLVRTVLAAQPACLAALRCILVDRAPGMRALHAAHFPASLAPDRVSSVETIPDSIEHGVIVANELLDNVPVRIMQRGQVGWEELGVIGSTDGLSSTSQPVDQPTSQRCSELVPHAVPGMLFPLQERSATLVANMLRVVQHGSVIAVDYSRPTTEEFALAGPLAWLRTYQQHQRSAGLAAALADPGNRDITVDVALDQLPTPDRVMSQAAALKTWGLEAVLADSAAQWEARTSDYDLTALRFRSHATEAPVLVDPSGLGGFSVLEWTMP
jgi:SAM-dependent MidA family methyltransferase